MRWKLISNIRPFIKKTWQSPGGEAQNEIDYICINKRWRSALLDVRAYHSADVRSDHHLLIASICLRLKRFKKCKVLRPFAVDTLKDSAIAESFRFELRKRFESMHDEKMVEDQWKQFYREMTETAEATIQRRRGSKRNNGSENKVGS